MIDLQVRQSAEVATSRRQEVQATVEQLTTLERGGLSDSVDRFERAVNLKLISGDFAVAQRSVVRSFCDQAANVVEERADLAECRVRGTDDLVRSLGVRKGFVDARDVATESLTSDQTCRVIFTAVDSKTSAQAGQRSLQIILCSVQASLSDQ